MNRVAARTKTLWRRGRDRENGNTTIEFVLIFPVFILLFTMAFEFGIWQTRQVLLDHGLDRTARAVRLGTFEDPTHRELITSVCDAAGLIPDCDNQLRLQMLVVTPDDVREQILNTSFVCRDRMDETDSDPLVEFINTNENNNIMFLRACALFDPFLPTFGVGLDTVQSGEDGEAGFYTVVSTSSYVVEPFR